MLKYYPTSKLILSTSFSNSLLSGLNEIERRPFVIFAYNNTGIDYSTEPFNTNFFQLFGATPICYSKCEKIEIVREITDGETADQIVSFNNITKHIMKVSGGDFPVYQDYIDITKDGYSTTGSKPFTYHLLLTCTINKSQLITNLGGDFINLVGVVNIFEYSYSTITNYYDNLIYGGGNELISPICLTTMEEIDLTLTGDYLSVKLLLQI